MLPAGLLHPAVNDAWIDEKPNWGRGRGHTYDNMSVGDKVTVLICDRELRAAGVLPHGGIARFYGTATLHTEGPIREAVWERLIEPERERGSEKKGCAVLIAVERAEDLLHEALEA